MDKKIMFPSFEEYSKNSNDIECINYWDLPKGLCVRIDKNKLPKSLRLRGVTKTISIGRLVRNFGINEDVNKGIKSILNWRNKRYEIKIRFPFSLVNKDYVQLYSLMLSEGNYRNDFRLHVPEEEFHEIFHQSLFNLFKIKERVNTRISKGIKVSYAPRRIRYLFPIPLQIPKFILNNKEFSKTYLRIAFEGEGSLHLHKDKTGTHRRIKLSRNIGIDNLVKDNLKYKEGKRIYFGTLKNDYPKLANKILKNPCPIILGEKLMLQKHFGVDSRIAPEYLRINKTSHRRGKISVKWTLTIHGININKFIEQIGFITKSKIEKSKELLKVKANRSRGFALIIIDKVRENNKFKRKDFMDEMKKLGYVNAGCYLTRYIQKGFIKKIERGVYAVIYQ